MKDFDFFFFGSTFINIMEFKSCKYYRYVHKCINSLKITLLFLININLIAFKLLRVL